MQMQSIENKEYLLDDVPVSYIELIKEAQKYGYGGTFLQTSIAAKILRENGHTVEVNKE